jgi:hypothetical protein
MTNNNAFRNANGTKIKLPVLTRNASWQKTFVQQGE